MLLFAAFYRKLREELSRKILKLVESGEMHSLKEKWWDARRRCLSGDDEMATTIKREGRCKEMAFILGMKQMGEQVLITIQVAFGLVMGTTFDCTMMKFHPQFASHVCLID